MVTDGSFILNEIKKNGSYHYNVSDRAPFIEKDVA